MKIDTKAIYDSVVKGVKASPTGLKNFLISNRMKSLYWRTGMMILSVIIASLLENLDIFTPYISASSITMFGLILGEISKAINNSVKAKRLKKA